MILRRSVILALGSMPLLARGAFSQTAVKVHRVGLLSRAAPLTDTNPVVVGLTAGFSKRGYVVGSSLIFERRAAEAQPDRLPQLVDDLKNKAELIITQELRCGSSCQRSLKSPCGCGHRCRSGCDGLVRTRAEKDSNSPTSSQRNPSTRLSPIMLQYMSLLLAQSGHQMTTSECPLSGVKRTSKFKSVTSAFDPKQTWC